VITTPTDSTKPNMARMYDYLLGRKDNVEVDRQAAEAAGAAGHRGNLGLAARPAGHRARGSVQHDRGRGRR
jgi:hypothetical protein